MNDGLTQESAPAGSLGRLGRFLVPLLLDVAIVIASYAAALSLKFDGDVPPESWRQLAWAGPLIAIAYIFAYQTLGVYRTAWQYGSVRDALLLAGAVAIVTAAILGVNLLLPKRPIPLSVNVISAAFIFLLHGTVRMLPRLWSNPVVVAESGPSERVLIVGAGVTGQLLAWELQNNRGQPYRAVGFIDDDPGLRGKRVHGVPVFGGRQQIPAAIERHSASLVAVAMPPEDGAALQEILRLVEPSKVPVRLVPALAEIMEGRARRGEMRPITMEDLLARETVPVDLESCRAMVQGKVVLITGAGGPIGSELARQLLELQPSALHLLDFNETALHELRLELLPRVAPESTVKPWLCNILDRQRFEDILEACHPQLVFHLAAYKHLPMMEENPDQAFLTNILGTLNVFEACSAVQVEQVVFLSSHSAVSPASVYGASKRVGELLVSSMSGRTRFCAVRLTNVIDAGGAVLNIFSRQIQRGEPISVTHPEVARYFLTRKEVAGLTLQAAASSTGGEIFLLDVGDEVRIGELAERLIRSQGLEPGKDIKIIYTQLRPGEKIRENLIADYERLEPAAHAKLLRAVSSLSFSGAELRAGIREIEIDLRRRPGNLPARIHALARIDRAELETAEPGPEEREPQGSQGQLPQ